MMKIFKEREVMISMGEKKRQRVQLELGKEEEYDYLLVWV